MKMPREFAFCRVCRLNHDQGKGHKYSKGHKQRLDRLLSKYLRAINDVRFFLANPCPLRPEDAPRNKFWCAACDHEILEEGSIFSCSNTIWHLASSEHLKNIKEFWHENGADFQNRHLYLIPAKELAKWQDACKATSTNTFNDSSKGDSNNIHSDNHYNKSAACDIASVSPFTNSISNFVKPLLLFKDNSCQIARHAFVKEDLQCSQSWRGDLVSQDEASVSEVKEQSVGTSVLTSCNSQMGTIFNSESGQEILEVLGSSYKSTWVNCLGSQDPKPIDPVHTLKHSNQIPHDIPKSHAILNGSVLQVGPRGQAIHGLTCIQPAPSLSDMGNVHSGASPPWLPIMDGVSCRDTASKFFLGKKQKLKKVKNPKRVGAAWAEQKMSLEHQKQGPCESTSVKPDDSWLPNFGRVWQSGSRRESKKEFDAETKLERKFTKIEAASLTKVHPYVSKRQKLEVEDGSNHVYSGNKTSEQ